MDLAGAFAEGELLLADIEPGAGTRKLSFSYRYRLERQWWRHADPGGRTLGGRARLRRLSEAVGWRVRPFPIDFRGSFQGTRHEWTVRVPRLRGQAAEITTTLVTAPRASDDTRRWHDAAMREGELTLRLPDGDRPGDIGVRLLMQPRRSSDLLMGTLFISFFICVAVAVGMVRSTAVTHAVESMTVLLAVVPSLIVSLLWRREHALVTLMFAGLRLVLLVVFLAGLLAVLALIGESSFAVMWWVWRAAFCVTAAGFAVVLVATVRAARRPPELRRSGR